MKKIFLVFFTCLIQSTFSFAQTNDNGSVSLLVGPAFPLGKFASKNASDKLAGFAKTGQAFSLSYTKLISKRSGIVVDIHGQRNSIDTKAFESSLAKIFAQYPNWKVSKESWLHGALLLGGIGQFPLGVSNKVSLITKTMIGVMYSKSPGLKGSSVDGTAFAAIEQTKKLAIGFTYSLGGGINCDITERLFFTSLVSYNGTNKMTYKNVRTTTFTSQGTPGSPDHAVQQSISTMNGNQVITSINLQAGLGIGL